MALPTTDPKNAPVLSTLSPETAYVTKDNIALPKEAQRLGVAVRADSRLEDASGATGITVASVPTPLSE
jgi:hypothetical protein